jgi:hypothetical protein
VREEGRKGRKGRKNPRKRDGKCGRACKLGQKKEDMVVRRSGGRRRRRIGRGWEGRGGGGGERERDGDSESGRESKPVLQCPIVDFLSFLLQFDANVSLACCQTTRRLKKIKVMEGAFLFSRQFFFVPHHKN